MNHHDAKEDTREEGTNEDDTRNEQGRDDSSEQEAEKKNEDKPKCATTTTTTQKKPKKKAPPFVPSQRFSTVDELMAAVEHLSYQQGFRYAKSFTYTSKHSRIVQRGKFKCKKRQDDQACDFFISFSGKIEKGAQHPAYYVIKTACLEHGHALSPVYTDDSSPEGGGVVKKKTTAQELSNEEVESIRQFKDQPPSAAEICKTLHERFGAHYSEALISELQSTISQQVYGTNREGLRTFLDFGYRILQQGGHFYVSHKHNLTFQCGAYQSQDMVKLHAAYKDHVVQDGILATNVFGMSLVPTMVCDCLGKLAISSVIVAPTETDADGALMIQTMQALELLVLNDIHAPQLSKSTTYTTDRTPLFSMIADKFSLHHAIAPHHFLGDIEKQVQMDAMGRNELKTACRTVLGLEDGSKFDEEMRALNYKYASNESALRFLESLQDNKTKICRAYDTGKFFACCGTVNEKIAKGGGISSNLKDQVALTKEQKKQNIFETAIDMQTKVFESYKSKALHEISTLLKKGAHWSAWVDKVWADENAKANLYVCSRIDDHTFNVAPEVGPEMTHRVTIPAASPGEVPECQCTEFASTRIPCRHICCALNSIDNEGAEQGFRVDHLKPRWRLANHPFYQEAAIKLGIGPQLSGEAEKGHDDQANPHESIAAYDNVEVPATPEAKRASLESLVQEIASHCTSSPHRYKVAYVALKKLRQQIQGNADDLEAAGGTSQSKRKQNAAGTSATDAIKTKKSKDTIVFLETRRN
jgi:hypothetical protein